MPHARTSALLVVAGVLALVLPLLVDLSPPTAPAARAEARGRPNIVVVMADDMRLTELWFAPTVRRLARHGVTFQNSFSPFPLCCPARASFLTGRLSHNHDVYWHGAPHGYADFDDSRTLATSLSSAGYRTGFVGKYLNSYGPARSKVSGMKSYRYVPRGWTDWYAAFENPHVPGIHGGTYHYLDTPFNINGRVRNLEGTYLAPHNGLPYEADDPPGSATAGATGSKGKVHGHEPSLRVPLVVTGPGHHRRYGG